MKKLVFAIICCLFLSQNCYAYYFNSPVKKIKARNEIKKLSKEIENNRDDANLYFKRGSYYWFLNKIRDAQCDYRIAYDIKPDFSEAYLREALLYYFDKKYGWAFEVLTELIKNNPDYALGYYFRASIYNEFHDYNNFIKDITKYIELRPDDTIIYSLRGGAYEMIGEYKLAINDYEKYLKYSKDTEFKKSTEESLKKCYEMIKN